MNKEIIINSSAAQTRVGITEEGNLVDFFVDHPEKRRMVGDIYLGRIARVLPGIRAAFIDIGMKHDAFLHFSDIGDRLEAFKSILDDDDDDDISDEDEENSSSSSHTKEVLEKMTPLTTTKLVKGENIMVQIIKEPVENKGVRVSTAISIPGRFCVLLPFDDKIGISKKIHDFKERRRLRKIARSILPDNCGLIIRTAAKDQEEESLAGDLTFLVQSWKDVQIKLKKEKPPAILYQDLNTTISVIRDLFTPDVSKVFIDSKKMYREIRKYVEIIQPSLSDKIEFYSGSESIFEAFKIEEQIKTLLGRKVSLPSGGYIIIEHTEAMVVVDVNSGRYAAKKEQELNSLKTDLEAAREIARQLRLRDIGGLIVCDFIDIEDEKNRKKIYDELKKEFRKDRAKVSVLPMTDYGLIQITRQRVRQNILQSMNETCPYCLGTGLLTTKSNLLHEIEEWIRRYKREAKESKIILQAHPTFVSKLKEGTISQILKFQFKYFIRIKLQADNKLNIGTFKFLSFKDNSDITNDYS